MSKYLASAAVMARRNVSTDGLDYYITPPEATKALLPFLGDVSNQTCLEPAAGGGHMVDVLKDAFKSVDAGDIADPENRGWGGIDFLKQDAPTDKYDWVITNPPFNLALPFVERMRDFGHNYAIIGRLSLVETISRYRKLWSVPKFRPSEIAVFVKRVHMAEGRLPQPGDASAVCYAWFVWRNGDNSCKFTWIDNQRKS